ncbi:hypothetical protein M406DRAFT_71919 [Cryphonectria parasitica EP155]|uniref:ABM domain-containing protein n=1 Tax=Cryphonectria parasitica (strain ATCC 38755 / EP155) TaxID=660469 RepID=A0A9P5CST5_CRYP1|nr:uncharacterized protein M406DRAFT_71919 [Cryphonectria parasitica EP155]KAF3768962.1 hypothetical protein M406DRAFT_71919 [Cryphonectria parasitica EP155]
MADTAAYYSVSTLAVKPENQAKVVEFFTKVAEATEKAEQAAQIYRWYKVEGKDEFVWIEKFASEKDYRAHQQSSHVQGLYKEYLQYITEPFVFFPVDTSEDQLVGGFERA